MGYPQGYPGQPPPGYPGHPGQATGYPPGYQPGFQPGFPQTGFPPPSFSNQQPGYQQPIYQSQQPVYQQGVAYAQPIVVVQQQQDDPNCAIAGCICGICIPLVGCINACANWSAPEGTQRKKWAKYSLGTAILFAIIWSIVLGVSVKSHATVTQTQYLDSQCLTVEGPSQQQTAGVCFGVTFFNVAASNMLTVTSDTVTVQDWKGTTSCSGSPYTSNTYVKGACVSDVYDNYYSMYTW